MNLVFSPTKIFHFHFLILSFKIQTNLIALKCIKVHIPFIKVKLKGHQCNRETETKKNNEVPKTAYQTQGKRVWGGGTNHTRSSDSNTNRFSNSEEKSLLHRQDAYS